MRKQKILVIILTLFLIKIGSAEEKILNKVTKTIEGEISAIGKDFIAIVYERNEEEGIEKEIFLPIEKETEVSRIKLNELKVGDIVRIDYEEITEEEEGKPKAKRKTKLISFVKPAQRKPEIYVPSEEENLQSKEEIVSENENIGGLFKGVKKE